MDPVLIRVISALRVRDVHPHVASHRMPRGGSAPAGSTKGACVLKRHEDLLSDAPWGTAGRRNGTPRSSRASTPPTNIPGRSVAAGL